MYAYGMRTTSYLKQCSAIVYDVSGSDYGGNEPAARKKADKDGIDYPSNATFSIRSGTYRKTWEYGGKMDWDITWTETAYKAASYASTVTTMLH